MYEKQSTERYVLWIHREDIQNFAASSDEVLPTRVDPKPGDVVAIFDREGNMLEASWRDH